MKMKAMAVAAFLLAPGAARADTHAPWPAHWNNWNDSALWVTVGNPGNTGEWSGESFGGYGDDRICGAVGYTFKIGKFEVTAGQYTAFLNAKAATDPYDLYNHFMWDNDRGCKIRRFGTPGSYTYSVAEDWANRPVNLVTWGDAARFCNWLTSGQTKDGSYYLNGAMSYEDLAAVTRKANGRYFIPTEDEWYKAAYYNRATDSYYDYPTGTNTLPSNDVADPDPGNSANFQQGGDAIGQPYMRTEVGEYENSASPYGTFDQGGNVWEWNETVPLPRFRGLRGGTYNDGAVFLTAAARYLDGAGDDSTMTGFRIVEVPEPATLLLLAFGGLASVRRRRGA